MTRFIITFKDERIPQLTGETEKETDINIEEYDGFFVITITNGDRYFINKKEIALIHFKNSK